MRPVRLDLNGFARLRDPATVDFSNAEYFAFVGTTGSGKSTVIDATRFALTVCAALVDLAQIGFMTGARRVGPPAQRRNGRDQHVVATHPGFDEGGHKQSGLGRLRGARGLAGGRRSRHVHLVPPAGRGLNRSKTES
jgi:hypothetical protein